MPGIAGIIGPTASTTRAAALDPMVGCLQRESFYASGTCHHNRLGLSAGWALHRGAFADCLPVWNETKDICLIFTGEDFADAAEVAWLKSRGHEFNPHNASYLVHLYEERGAGFLEKLNGWFSGVIADLRENKVILFNDRYGLSRVYLHQNADGLFFSSEAKSLLRVLPATRKADPAGLAEFLSCGCALQDRTLFAGISLLPAGSCWTFVPGRPVQKQSYFQRDTWENLPRLNEAEYYEQLKSTFTRILPKYLRNGQPVAMSLTGGLDGRMIMAWAGASPGSLPCYTFGGPYRDCTDVTIARRVAKLCGQPHQTIPVNGGFLSKFAGFAEKAVYVSDGAMDVTGSVEFYVNQLAREIAPVRLTGNYGSEILRSNVAFKAQPLNETIFSPEFIGLGRAAADTYAREAQGSHPLSFIAFKQVPWHHCSRLSVEQSQLTLRAPYLDNDLVALAYRTPAHLAFSKEPSLRLIADGHPALGKVPTDRGLVYQPTPVLTKAQHLYQEFTFRTEYAWDYGMPQWLARINGALGVLRLENMFLGRHKFYHFRVWYRDQLASYVREILLDRRTLARPHLQAARVEQMVAEHVNGVRNHTSELHQLLSVELIHRQLIEQN